LRLLVDNNLSPSLAHSLQPIFPEFKIDALRDKFAANTSDVDWIKTLDSEGGWAVLTAERRQITPKAWHLSMRSWSECGLLKESIVQPFRSQSACTLRTRTGVENSPE
jgi:PIN like domain